MDNIEKRLQVLEDIEAIKTLHATYFAIVDSRQFDKLNEVFLDSAKVIIAGTVCNGLTEVIQFYKEVTNIPIYEHYGHDPIINMLSDSNAKGIWSLLSIRADGPDSPALWSAGRYQEEYVKVDGVWKIQRMELNRVYRS